MVEHLAVFTLLVLDLCIPVGKARRAATSAGVVSIFGTVEGF